MHPDLDLWDSSHLGGLVKSGYLCFPFSLYRRLWPLLSGVMHRYELSPLLVLWVRGVRSWLLKVVHFQKGYLPLLCYTICRPAPLLAGNILSLSFSLHNMMMLGRWSILLFLYKYRRQASLQPTTSLHMRLIEIEQYTQINADIVQVSPTSWTVS